MRTDQESWKVDYRIIYEILYGSPLISNREIISRLGTQTGSKRIKEVFDEEYIVGPEIRKRSFQNLSEYMYFVTCKDPELLYMKLREDPRVVYHAKASGFCNLWLITNEKIDIDGDIVVEGQRSDYFLPYVPNHSWERTLEIISDKVNAFDSTDYQPQGIITTHLNETSEWDDEDEILYKYFKFNLRKPFTPLLKQHGISNEKRTNFLKKLPETCTTHVSYYPNRVPSYDSYLFTFETDYKDFIVDLFSQLPASASFFKVSNRLFALTYVPIRIVRKQSFRVAANESFLPLLTVTLEEKGIVKSRDYSIVEYFWAKSH